MGYLFCFLALYVLTMKRHKLYVDFNDCFTIFVIVSVVKYHETFGISELDFNKQNETFQNELSFTLTHSKLIGISDQKLIHRKKTETKLNYCGV